jgi:trans-aconitate methyltransferase
MKFAWNSDDYAKNSTAQAGWALELLDCDDLRGDESVLDIGCGDGKVTAELAARVPRGEVVGIDSSDEMIRLAGEKHGAAPNLRFDTGDASRLNYSEDFDLVFSSSVLHWILDHGPVLRGIHRALRPGGLAALRMGGKGAAAEVLDTLGRLIREPEWARCFDGFDFRYGFYTPDEYRPWLADAGLSPLRVELMPRIMEHTRDGFTGWFRTTWMGYTSRVPDHARERFIETFVDRFIADHGAPNGRVRVTMTRLDVIAARDS